MSLAGFGKIAGTLAAGALATHIGYGYLAAKSSNDSMAQVARCKSGQEMFQKMNNVTSPYLLPLSNIKQTAADEATACFEKPNVKPTGPSKAEQAAEMAKNALPGQEPTDTYSSSSPKASARPVKPAKSAKPSNKRVVAKKTYSAKDRGELDDLVRLQKELPDKTSSLVKKINLAAVDAGKVVAKTVNVKGIRYLA